MCILASVMSFFGRVFSGVHEHIDKIAAYATILGLGLAYLAIRKAGEIGDKQIKLASKQIEISDDQGKIVSEQTRISKVQAHLTHISNLSNNILSLMVSRTEKYYLIFRLEDALRRSGLSKEQVDGKKKDIATLQRSVERIETSIKKQITNLIVVEKEVNILNGTPLDDSAWDGIDDPGGNDLLSQ